MKTILNIIPIIVCILGTGSIAIAIPTLTSPHSAPPICDSSVFSYTPTSSTAGTTFSWTRSVIANISNPSASGTGNPGETLYNTGTFPVTVTYVYTLFDGTSTNTEDVTVVVQPTPKLSNPTPVPFCSGPIFSFLPSSLTAGTVFSWRREYISGISNLSATGIGGINETLLNTTIIPVGAVYVYTLTANGCSHIQNLTVTVNPVPDVITGDTSVCEGQTTILSSAKPWGTWSTGDATVATVGATNGVVSGVTAGATAITYTMIGGCFNSRGVVVENCLTEITNVAKNEGKHFVYPNPTSGKFFINLQSSGTLYLFSPDGREVMRIILSKNLHELAIPKKLPCGVYRCKFVDEDGTSHLMQLTYLQ